MTKNNMYVRTRRIKRDRNKNVVAEEENQVKTFIIIVLAIVGLAAILVGVTELFNKKENIEEEVETVEISYDNVSVGTILNRPNKDYYVLLYRSDDNSAPLYASIMSMYQEKSHEDGYIKIFYCDLAKAPNSNYYLKNNTSNKEAKTVEDFSFGDLTLLKISKGKITKYIESIDEIKKVLS